MILLQPELWILLPAAGLPIAIHLLNRLRYRSVPWGAMTFLLRAARESTRRSRLRQFLVLACRTIALLALLAAALRPLAGGRLGRFGRRTPDVVVILLDRSSSMETRIPRLDATKREWALDQAGQIPPEAYRGSRFVLVESARLQRRHLPGPTGLRDLDLAQPTDTATDGPALVRAAADLLEAGERAEIWILTDLQHSAWRPESPAWPELDARLAGRPGDLRVRVLALPDPPRVNASVSLQDAATIRRGGELRDRVDLRIRRTADAPDPIPLAWERNGVREPIEIRAPGGEARLVHDLETRSAAEAPFFWGRFTLPPDDRPSDNAVWVAFGPPPPLQARVRAADPGADSVIRRALAPDPVFDRIVRPAGERADPEDGLIVWQDLLPAGPDAELLRDFLDEGGVLLLLPPSGDPPPPVRETWGAQWGATEDAPEGNPFRVAYWDERDGPLAHAADGRPLAVSDVRIARRRAVALDADAGWRVLAAGPDGFPFLARRPIGRGEAVLCTTLPLDSWSNLAGGPVLLPVLQRLLARGAQRAAAVRYAECGAWRPGPGGDPVTDETTGMPAPDPVRAGVYRVGDRRIVLNRPAAEDDPARLEPAAFAALLPGVRVEVTAGAADRAGGAEPGELAPLLLIAALAFLTIEGGLLLSDAPRRPVAAGGRRP